MKRTIAAAVAASTLGGAAAGATLLGPGLAGAQDDADDAESSDPEGPTEEAPIDVEAAVAERLAEALQPLVDDGTLTEAQRDAVIERLQEEGPLPGRHRDHHHHGVGPGIFGTEVSDILGLDRDEIAEALADGQSLADLAEANGVDPQDLVDALVAEAEERVNDAVESGRLDEERAEEILGNAEERAEDVVNGEAPFGRRGPGHRGFGPPADDEAASGSDVDAAFTA